MQTTLSPPLRFLLGAACFIVIVAGMKASADVLVPFLLSAFIGILCAPPLFWLQARRVPTVVAVTIVLTVFVLVMVIVSALVGASVSDFMLQLPEYQAKLRDEKNALLTWLEARGIEAPVAVLKEQINPGAAMSMVKNVLTGLGGVLTDSFLILLTVLFILFEASSFPDKLKRAMNDPNHASVMSFKHFNSSVKQYLIIKSWVSLATGLLVTLWLLILGVDYPILWGLLAFMLNYVPNIGSIIAAFPAVLLALIQIGPGTAALTAAGYLAVNIVMGNVVEPRFLGQGLGLSTLVVFISLVFWGWVLGPVGMLLSIPLTMILKIALENNQETRWMAVMLGNK
ncbi:MAG: AI-2E family transporter [Ketobacteraceae bacterium]|nr:AI-2E family transporter [Ketobacteraceae bacterium]